MRILGIEFGSWSLKAVELESRFRRMDVLDFHEVRLPLEVGDPKATYKVALAKLFARLPSHPEKIVTSLPSSLVSVRFFQLPIKSAKKVEQTYRFELEDNIPFKLENTLLEHHLSRTKEGTAVTAVMAPRIHVASHLAWLQEVGVDPDWLSFDGMGLINLYFASQAKKKDKKAPIEPAGCRLILDIGHSKTGFSVVEEDRLIYSRTISWGGAHLTHSLATGLDVPLDQAELLKHRLDFMASPDRLDEKDSKTLEIAIKALAPFFADLHHSLVSLRAAQKKSVESVLISGGSSALQGLAAYLADKLRKPTEVFQPLTQRPKNAEVPESGLLRFGEAYGQATVFERKSVLLFNFRKGELAKKTSLTDVGTFLKNPHVVKLLRYSGVLAAILFLHVSLASHFAAKEAESAEAEIEKVFSQTFREVPKKMRSSLVKDTDQLNKFLKQKENQLNQKIKMLSTKRTPMLSLVKQVSQAFPPDVKVDVNDLTIDDRTVAIEGVVYEGNLSGATENLKKIPEFQDIQLSQNGQRFTYNGKVKGK